MSVLVSLVDFIVHIDEHLESIISEYGALTYAILFAIVFCETGLVVTPILPGDSLLFAAGTFAAIGDLRVEVLISLLVAAAILGDAVNYSVGRYIGPRAFRYDNWFLKREHLVRTQKFYEKYGGKTIILARFIPIVRTFAPFVAGIGGMQYRRFVIFNVTGAVLWVVPLTLAGYFFGNVPVVRDNFSLVILAIIAISLMPIFIEWWKHRRSKRAAETEAL